MENKSAGIWAAGLGKGRREKVKKGGKGGKGRKRKEGGRGSRRREGREEAESHAEVDVCSHARHRWVLQSRLADLHTLRL